MTTPRIMHSDNVENATVLSGFKNLKMLVTSNTTISITADALCMLDSEFKMRFARNASLTINTATVGANGLDTGSIAVSAWYYVFAIYNATTKTTAALLSLSSTSPTLPSGYTYFTRLGAVRTNANLYLYRTIQYGNRAQYTIDGSALAGLPAIATGSLGNTGTPTYVACDISAVIPPTAKTISLLGYMNGQGNIMVAPNNAYGGFGNYSGKAPIINMGFSGGGNVCAFAEITLETTNLIYYAGNNTQSGVCCVGWEDSL